MRHSCRLFSTSIDENALPPNQKDFEIDDEAVFSEDDDTVFALSSGASAGQATALAVIRITGSHAPAILQQLSNNKPLPKPRMASLRNLVNPITQQPLDQALVLYFPAPNSFTGEDVIELHCHGSRAVTKGVLQALADATVARYAEAGEFTQRAWRNGKLDVLQIEALADLLTADTDLQRTQALAQLDGKLSATYDAWRQELIAGLAHAEAVIDFGDDERLGDDDDSYLGDDPDAQYQEEQESVWGGVTDKMNALACAMDRQLLDQRRGELVREGLQIAIVGPPNAGN